MTQEQVAEAMNISIQSLSCIELGKKAIRPENLYNLCIALDVSADYVLMGEKSAKQLEGVSKKLSVLKEDDYRIIESLICYWFFFFLFFGKTTSNTVCMPSTGGI